MNIAFPETTTIIDAIREAIGHPIVITYVASAIACPNILDSLDPISNKSTYSLCPTCSGEYWINQLADYSTKAVVTWNNLDDTSWETGGKIHEGDCTAQIKYDATADRIYQTSMYAVVDNIKMSINRVIFRGTPAINRVILIMIENLGGGTIPPG